MRIIFNNQRNPYGVNSTPYNSSMYHASTRFRYPSNTNKKENQLRDDDLRLRDYGPEPFAVNINDATKQNDNFRTALWTGDYMQLTLMSIPVGGEIGLENHPNNDQFIRIEEGQGIVKMGDRKDRLDFQEKVLDDYAFIIPAGKWHNLINTGNIPIKLYSIYAPPQHPHGTVHRTAEDAEEENKPRNNRKYR
jgi:mannose-6-phosphate isomerase-like protein (cupin superfamily)